MAHLWKGSLVEQAGRRDLALNSCRFASQVLRLDSVQRADAGMYQCFVSNGQETAQGSAHLRLGGTAYRSLAGCARLQPPSSST